MLAFLSKLLPKEYKGLLALGQQIFANLDTKEERADALAYIKEALSDGQVTVPEWGRIGGKLGIADISQDILPDIITIQVIAWVSVVVGGIGLARIVWNKVRWFSDS